jgi:hypothetical protein
LKCWSRRRCAEVSWIMPSRSSGFILVCSNRLNKVEAFSGQTAKAITTNLMCLFVVIY